ncbi:MAG TPA: polysaccharide biosynthesis/export family protein [Silvibacterium sp.]|nr:polysaccharide biosynthesis/export family protein [Silvibacterium sp.]
MKIYTSLSWDRIVCLVVILTAGSAAAYAQASPESKPVQPDQSIAMVSQPVKALADAHSSYRAALTSTSVLKDYKIGIDDVLTINVWHEPDLSRNITVRPDGKISLPLVGEVQAAGKTPPQLEAELRSSLSQFIKGPELTVIVAEIRSLRVNIIGQVVHPGTFAITQQMGVLDIIAEAGGLKEFAKQKKIYVLRETSAGQRIRMSYDYRDVLRGKKNAQDIMLRANDTVVVP